MDENEQVPRLPKSPNEVDSPERDRYEVLAMQWKLERRLYGETETAKRILSEMNEVWALVVRQYYAIVDSADLPQDTTPLQP